MSDKLAHDYRPQRSWGKVMFSQACVILFTGGVGVCLSACWDTTTTPQEQTPLQQTPPTADTPRSRHPTPREQTTPQSRQPPRADTPPGADSPAPPGVDTPQHRACWEIRSTRGRYASYWNAILLFFDLTIGSLCLTLMFTDSSF